MEGIHSFEQRSSTEIRHEPGGLRNRVVVVDRHNPTVIWSTPNRVEQSKGSKWLQYIGLRKREDALAGSSTISAGPADDIDFGPFPPNEWKTSKYTLFNFLPRNLFEQFKRLANFYFLVIAVIQIVMPYSPVGPATSLLPLLFVISTTAFKQAYEDYLRHKLDREVNNRVCHVLRGKKLIRVRSKEIRVGDFVYVRNNEEIPCDMILIAASGPGDRCYVTTSNLDGETSLKSRSCFNIKSEIGSIEKLDDTMLVVECELPNATLYEFNGNLRAPQNRQSYSRLVEDLNEHEKQNRQLKRQSWRSQSPSQLLHTIYRRIKRSKLTNQVRKSIRHPIRGVIDPPDDRKLLNTQDHQFHEIPLDITNLLLRASRLRNTSHIYGLAIYTGRDTKLAHNSHVKPNKFSSIESRINLFLIMAFGLLVIATLLGAFNFKRHYSSDRLAPVPESLTKNDSFGKVLLTHFLLYNYLVPISLNVTLEFVKFLGTMQVVKDQQMRSTVWKTLSNTDTAESGELKIEESGTKGSSSSETSRSSEFKSDLTKVVMKTMTKNPPSKRKKVRVLEGARCNSSDLNEDLGQVEVLFSDKTGTLTENKMTFMACSSNGQLFRSIGGRLYLQPPNICSVPVSPIVHKVASVATNRYAFITPAAANLSRGGSRSSSTRGPDFDHRVNPPIDKMELISDLSKYEHLVDFFICLCLCSTITVNENIPIEDCLPDKTNNEYDLQSASPDEESLISAGNLVGLTMCKSSEHDCYVAIDRTYIKGKITQPLSSRIRGSQASYSPGHRRTTYRYGYKPLVETANSTDRFIVRHFKRLTCFDFTSVRKRMSVVYYDCDNDCTILVAKGSESLLDCIRMTRLDKEAEHTINVSMAYFEAFAESGLRTMLVARKIMSSQDYDNLMADLKEARLAQSERNKMLNIVYKKAESDLRLIGTTAVEDSLQSGVPETISNLKDAGIKVWLLTGDKVETAISVANLCKLLDRGMVLFHLVRQQDSKSCIDSIKKFKYQIRQAVGSVPVFERSHSRSSSANRGIKSPGVAAFKYIQTLDIKSLVRNRADLEAGTSPRFAMIVDGRSLYYALKYTKEDFAQICKLCTCVLGCRLSPLQKAEIVSLVKTDADSPVTAAIGDGANDVSMIQESHVGIGIIGKEGRQAVNSSDFSIYRFFMLNRLLFVHGNLFYHRTANLAHFFFYKNLLFVFPQFIYSFHTIASGVSLYHPFELICFNLVFTSLPVLVYGLHEIHIDEAKLEKFPGLYKMNKHNGLLTVPIFASWLMLAFVQASLAFYWLYYMISPRWTRQPSFNLGEMDGTNGFALLLYFVIVLLATIRLYLLARRHSFLFNLSSLFSIALLPAVFHIYSLIDMSDYFSDNSIYQKFNKFISEPNFWFALGTTTAVALVADLIWFIGDRIITHRKINRLISGAES